LFRFKEFVSMKKIIALLGPKHCGKTEAGKALATLMRGAFFDLDDEMKNTTGKSARALYKEGAGVFQAAEREALERVFDRIDGGAGGNNGRKGDNRQKGDDVIIALGGGFIDNEAALALLKAYPHRVLVFLSVSAETAWDRIKAAVAKSGELPAFLQTEDPEAAHREIHRRRSAAYRGIASFVVDAERKTAVKIALEIVAAGGLWQNSTP
jgi:shikimate kinase